MKDLHSTIHETLGKRLDAEGYSVDLIPIPKKGDRMVRIRTMEEMLNEFDSAEQEETVTYLIQIKEKPQNVQQDEQETELEPKRFQAPKPTVDGVYLPNGKLNISYLFRNAELLMMTGEYALARNIYKTILHSGEHTANALYFIGRCFEAEGRTDEAIRNYEESITYHPQYDTYRRLATLLIRQKKDLRAADVFDTALGLKDLSGKDRFEIHKAAGNCWLRAERMEEAQKHYLAALELEPNADSVRVNLGALNLEAGKTADAKKCFQDALTANPKNDKALAGLGSCLLSLGDKRTAHDCFVKALEININNPTAIFHLVKCAYEIKSYAAAERILSEYIEVAPVNVNLLYSLGGLQFHLGKVSEAKLTVNKILQLQPDHTGARDLLDLIEKLLTGRS